MAVATARSRHEPGPWPFAAGPNDTHHCVFRLCCCGAPFAVPRLWPSTDAGAITELRRIVEHDAVLPAKVDTAVSQRSVFHTVVFKYLEQHHPHLSTCADSALS